MALFTFHAAGVRYATHGCVCARVRRRATSLDFPQGPGRASSSNSDVTNVTRVTRLSTAMGTFAFSPFAGIDFYVSRPGRISHGADGTACVLGRGFLASFPRQISCRKISNTFERFFINHALHKVHYLCFVDGGKTRIYN